MPHLSYDCHGRKHCLDDFSRKLSTLYPAESLPLQNFVHLPDEEKGLLEIAAHACGDLCSDSVCTSSSDGTRHLLKLVVENGVVLVLNDDFGLHQCTCREVVYRVPKSLSQCILSGWEIYVERLRRWEALLNLPNYRSPSPDLPELSQLHQSFARNTAQKRAAEETDEGEQSDSSCPSPPPAKRMRTGPCADIVRKITARKAADAADAAASKDAEGAAEDSEVEN
ncbi:hypothetical protein V5O48_010672 [Marasmius crinis-equi]|uniref:Uncharacterized protein n=1 Tax=Marasmius crinis-equi TaxID=585013 RepID=A0ABR3F7Q0_9AGAR